MSQLVITAPIPHIDAATVKKGMSVCFRPSGGPDYDGFVETIAERSVTIRAYNNTTGKTEAVTVTAQQLKDDAYEYFKFSEHMGDIKTEGSTPWTTDVQTRVIDPSVCKNQYFIQFKLTAASSPVNALIGVVSEASMTVLIVSAAGAGKPFTLTVADMDKAGFEAIVSPDLSSGGGTPQMYISPEVSRDNG